MSGLILQLVAAACMRAYCRADVSDRRFGDGARGYIACCQALVALGDG